MNRAPTLANRLAADLADLRALHITDPDVAEHIRAQLVLELVALTSGDRVPLSVKADEV